MAAVLGDVRGHWRQFRHLMPARLADGMARVQAARAVAARLRREEWTIASTRSTGTRAGMVSRMARLPAGVASTLQGDVLAAAVDPRGQSEAGGFDVMVEFCCFSASWGWGIVQSASLAPRAVGAVVHFPRAVVQSPAPRDHECHALARHVATASCALAPSTRAYKPLQKPQVQKIMPSIRGRELLRPDRKTRADGPPSGGLLSERPVGLLSGAACATVPEYANKAQRTCVPIRSPMSPRIQHSRILATVSVFRPV